MKQMLRKKDVWVLLAALIGAFACVTLIQFISGRIDDHREAPMKHLILSMAAAFAVSFSSTPAATIETRIDAVTTGALSIEKLEAMTAVCSVGLDMIIIPGDTTPAIISGIIADEAAIGMVNSKTTAVRVIPAVGRKEGETLTFGGLLGYGPVIKVNRNSPEVFINRGGHIPAPLQSLKN